MVVGIHAGLEWAHAEFAVWCVSAETKTNILLIRDYNDHLDAVEAGEFANRAPSTHPAGL